MSAFRLRSTGLLAFALMVTVSSVSGQSVQMTPGFTSLSDGGLIVDPSYGQSGNVFGTSAIGGRGGYLWVEGVFGERPGSQGNYFNVGTFLPGPEYRGGMTFADVQIFGDENARIGVDANIGWRTLINDDTMFGAYALYTHDHSINEYAYDWAGGGLQLARSNVALDSNFYIPLGHQENNIGRRMPTSNITVRDRSIGFIDLQRVEQAMSGADLNVTAWVPGYEWLYGGAGVYSFNSQDGDDTSGYRLRGGVDVGDMQVNVNVTNDSLFGTAADVSLTWLIGRDGIGNGDRAIERRLYDRVVKQRRIATTTYLKDVFTAARDSRGGTLDIAYVRNNNLNPGDGTFDNPFSQLDFANGADVDIIAVLRGSTDPMNKLTAGNGLFLSANQRLLGEGMEQFVTIPNRGTFLVPGLDIAGPNPYVTANPGAAIVTMASNTEVNGLNLMPAAGGFAIRGNNLQNFQIANINQDVPMGMSTGPGSGILLRNAFGTGIIDNVAFNISDPSAYGGIRVENTNMSRLNLAINNVPFLTGGQVGVGIKGTNSEINAEITDVNASDNGIGLLVESFGSAELNIGVENSSFDNASTVFPGQGHGIAIVGNQGLINMGLSHVSATGADTNNLLISLRNDSLLNLGGTDVDLTNAGLDAINLFSDDSDANVNFLRVFGDDAGRDGINILANNTATVDFIVTDGSFTNVGRDATHVEAFNLSTVNLVVDPTPATGAGRHGLFFNAQGDSQIDILFQDSNLSTAMAPTGSHAVFGTLGDGSLVSLVLDNSHASTAGGNAMLVNASGGSQFDALFLNSSFVGAGANAFELNLNNSVGNIMIDGGSAGGATNSAYVVNATNGSQFSGMIVDSNLSAAGQDGIRLNFDDSTGALELTNTPVANAGDNAYDLTFTNGAVLDVTVANSPSFGAMQNAVMFNGDTGSDLLLSLTDSELSTNANPAARGGIFGTLDNGSTATVNVLRSDVSMPGMNALDDGLMVSADNGSMFVGNITDSMFTDVVGSAFVVTLDNGSTGMLNLDNAPGSRAGVDGLFALAENGSTFEATLTNGTVFNDVGLSPLRIVSNSGSTAVVVGEGVSGNNAGADAINLSANGGQIGLSLTGPGSFDNAMTGSGLTASLSAGANLLTILNGVTLNNAFLDGVHLDADSSTFDIRLGNSGVNNAMTGDALHLDVNNSQGSLLLSNTDAAMAGDNAVDIEATNGSNVAVQLLNGVSLDNPGNDVFNIDADNSVVTIAAPGISGNMAGGDVVDFTAANGSTVQVDIGGTMLMPASFNGAAGDGVMGVLTGGSTGIVNLTDASFTGLGGDTFSIMGTDSAFGGTITRTDFTGANGDAVMLVFDNSTGDLDITNSQLDMAGMDGLHVDATNGSLLDIDIIDSSVTGAGDDAYDVDFLGGSIVDLFVDPTPSTGAGDHGFEFLGNTGSQLIATFEDSDLSTAVDPTGSTGIFGDVYGGSSAVLNLTNSDVASAGGNAIDVFVLGNSSFTVNATDISLASANGSGVVLFQGQSASTLNFSNVDVSGAGGDAINIDADDGSTTSVNLANVSLANAGDNGLIIDVNASGGQVSLTNVNANDASTGDALGFFASNGSSLFVNGNNVSGARAGMDGLDIESNGMSVVEVTLTNAGSFESAGDSGIEITADNSRAVATVSGTPGSPVNFNGSANGLEIDATNGAFAAAFLTDITMTDVLDDAVEVLATGSTANVVITNGDLSGAGNGAGDHGVQLNYANSTGGVNLTDTSVDGAFEDAFNITTTAGSDLDMKLTTVTATGAGDDTFDLSGTTLGTLMLDIDPNDLTGAGDNTFEFNFSQGAGLSVMVADSPMSTEMTPVGNNVIQGTLNSGATASFNVINSSMTHATNDAVNIVASGAGSTFVGMFDANSDMNDAGDNALDLTATNGATIGIATNGVSFDNTMGGSAILGNFNNATGVFNVSNFSADMSANIGLELTADNDASIGGSFTNGSFDMNASHGIKLTTNPDMSPNDNSVIDLDFNMVTADGNFGDGLNAMAFNGNDTAGMPQMTGIIVDFANGSLSNNSNMNMGDGIGYGVSGMADGDGSGPQNTRITFNFLNTEIVNNEEGAMNRIATNGGAVDFNFTGGTIGGQNGLVLCADGPMDVFNFSLNGTTIGNNPTGPGLLVKAINDGVTNAEITNVDFSGNGEEGVRFLANTGGNIALTLRDLDIMSNGTTGSFDGIYGTVGVMDQAESNFTAGKFSNVEVNLVNVNIGDNPESALDIDVATGGVLSNASMVIGGTFGGTGQENSTGGSFDEVELNVTGAGSHLGMSFDGTTVNNAVADAFNLSATMGGNLALGINNVQAMNAGGEALDVSLANSGLSTSITGLDGRNAGGQGVVFDLTNGSFASVNNFNNVNLQGAMGGDALEVNITGSQLNAFNSNMINVSGSADTGLDLNIDSSIANFSFDGVMADDNNVHGLFALYNNGSVGTLNVNDIWAQNNTNGAPFVANVFNGSTLDAMVTNGAFTGSSVFVNNVQVQANNGSTANATFDNINANGPMINGFFLDYQNGSTGNVAVTNSMASGATNTGVVVNALSGSDVTANIDNVTTAGAGGDGVAVTVDNSTADATLNAIQASGVGGDGVRVAASGSTIDTSLSNIMADGVGQDGVEVTAANSVLTADISNIATDMATGRGVVVSATNGTTANVNSFNNVFVTNAGTTGIDIDVLSSQLMTFDASTVMANGSGGSGLDILVDGAGATGNFEFDTLMTNLNGGDGTSLVVDDTATLSFDATTLTANANDDNGVSMSAGQTTAGSTLDVTVTDSTASSNGQDGSGSGIVSRVSGAGTEAQVLLDAVIVNVNQNNGADFGVDFGATLDVTLNNGVSASGNNNGDGVLFSADGAGTTASLTSTSGINQFAGNNGDGVDVNLTNMATATDITIVGNASQNFGDGVNVTTDASGVTINNLALTDTDLTANNNLGTGLVVDLDNVSGMTTIDISNFSVTGNQGVGNARGVAGIDVSLRNMTLDSVTMDSLDVSGNTGGTGVGLLLDGTTVTGDVELTNFTANSNGGSGADLLLMNGSSVDSLTVNGSASGNLADGVSIVANDGTAQTIGDLTIGGTALSINNNGGTGLIVDLDNISGLTDVDISGLTAIGNVGAGNPRGVAGIDVAIANSMLDTLNMSDLMVSGNPGGTGIGLLLDGTTVTTSVDLSDFTADMNGGGGVSVDIRNASTINNLAVNGSASGNMGGDGLSIVSNVGAPSTINGFSLSGAALTLNNNAGNGLTVDFDGVLGLTDFDLSSLTVSGNTQDQINVRLANMTLDTVTMNDIVAIGPGAGVGVGDGIEVTFDGTMVNDLLRFERIISMDNGEDGLQLNYLNGANTPEDNGTVRSGIDVGIFDNNGLSGIHVVLDGASSAALDVTNSTGLTLGTRASAANNGLHGVNVELTGNSKLTMDSVDLQIFDGNAGSGVIISSANSDFLNGSSFTNNSMSDNGSFGFFGRFLNGTFDIAIGDTNTAGMGNLIDNNVGAGIAIEMIQATTGRLAISDNQITNTANDGDPNTIYGGDAIVVSQLGTTNPAQATNTLTDPLGGPGLLIQRNMIGITAGGAVGTNAGHGVTFQLEEQSQIDGLQINQNMIANNLDGLNFRRFDEVEIIGFEINENVFMANRDDAIDISGENDSSSSLVMDVTIADNDIMTSGNNGIELQVNADAGLDIDILRNNIIGNGNDGINATEITLDPSDLRMISGTWDDNIIANNTNRGIFSAAQLSFVSASNNTIGAVLDAFGQVMIDGNGSTGIEINSSGFTTTSWTNNQVIQNGRLQTGNRAVGHGFDFQGSAQSITLTNNLIRENFQDGIEIRNNNTFYDVTMVDNRVQLNEGRGLDVLNQLDGRTTIDLQGGTTGNVFNSNAEEGIYTVNTSAGGQNQTDFANATLATNGNQDRTARLTLLIDNATVQNNGDANLVNNGLLASAGLMVRSGTTAGPGSIQTGFNNNAPSNTQTHFATDQSGNPNFINGGVFVQLTNSTFGGNFGDDTFFHGFVSTGDPGAIGGTWNDMEYTPTGTQNTDTLARLDLVIGTLQNGDGNVFDSVNFTNSMRQGTPGGQAGAYFSNADGTFKSRLGNATPPGPFSNGGAGRRRNAQRTPIRAFRDGSVLRPDGDGVLPFDGTPDNGRFQFPGVGDSTFRVRATSGNVLELTDLNNNGFRDAFEGFEGFGIFDDDVLNGGDFGLIEDDGEQNGVGFTGQTGDEDEFGWGTF